MSQPTIALDRFGLNTITLAGPLERKLSCIRAAGFSGVELWPHDLVCHPAGVEDAVRLVRASGLAVTDWQPLRDFECAPLAVRPHRLEIARQQLTLMQRVGADLLLVCSSTSPLAIDDADRAAEDLYALGDLAASMGMRICYEALSWGRHVHRWQQAWDIVRRCGHRAVGLNLDSFHMAVRGDDTPATLDELAQVPADRIFLVQLADYFHPYGDQPAHMMELARHQRLFPGEGLHDTRPLVQWLQAHGYRGRYTFEVFNDDYLQADPAHVAQRGMAAARWLSATRPAGHPAPLTSTTEHLAFS